MTRAAIYARYSSDLQSESSIDDQVRLCRQHGEREGMAVADVFTDYAISGGSLNNRPGMLSLLEAARQGRFDIVLAEALDRMSRDQEDIAAIHKRLRHADVRLVTLAEGEINELHVGLKGTMNALFLKDLAQKTRRGQRGRVEAGKIPGGNSYGYKMVRRLLDDGTISTGEREIDPEQAAIIRRIFAEYAGGLPPRQIAAHLNAEGIPSPRGGTWNASTINGNRQRRNGILNNELYLGRIIYNRQRFVKDPETGKRVSRPNPEHEWVTSAVPALRIVEDDVWQKVQAIKSRYASRTGNRRQTRKRLLTGLVRCGACGGSMTIVNRERYYCSARREKGTCESAAGVAASDLEDRVLTGLKDILLGNDALIDEFTEAFNTELARLRRQHGQRDRSTHSELTRVNAAIRRCLDYITGGEGPPGLVRDELNELERRKRELEDLQASLRADRAVEVHPNMAALYRKKVSQLQALLEDETSRPEAMATIRSLVDRVEVHAGPTRGKPEIVLVGALAAILAFMQQRAIDGESGAEECRVLMVAGAGFEPATFRL